MASVNSVCGGAGVSGKATADNIKATLASTLKEIPPDALFWSTF